MSIFIRMLIGLLVASFFLAILVGISYVPLYFFDEQNLSGPIPLVLFKRCVIGMFTSLLVAGLLLSLWEFGDSTITFLKK